MRHLDFQLHFFLLSNYIILTVVSSGGGWYCSQILHERVMLENDPSILNAPEITENGDGGRQF